MEEACDYSTYFQRGFAEVMLPAGVLVNHQQTRVLEAAQSCGVGSVGVHHDLHTIPCCATVIFNIDKIRVAAGDVAFLIFRDHFPPTVVNFSVKWQILQV